MALSLNTGAQNAMCSALTALANGGTVQVRTGTKPATVGTAATGTLLGTLTLAATAFGSPTNGTATAGTITGDTSADATGTAGWFRVLSSTSTGVWDGTITATGGGGDLTLDSVSVVTGGAINVTSWTITVPAS